MSERHPQAVVEADVPFHSVLQLIRISSLPDAADLLHSALRVAFNNGEAIGCAEMAKIAENAMSGASHSTQEGQERD